MLSRRDVYIAMRVTERHESIDSVDGVRSAIREAEELDDIHVEDMPSLMEVVCEFYGLEYDL